MLRACSNFVQQYCIILLVSTAARYREVNLQKKSSNSGSVDTTRNSIELDPSQYQKSGKLITTNVSLLQQLQNYCLK